jgi:CBS domain-containing protein
MWSFLIGLFLRKAAAGSYQQLLLRQTLEGEPVRRFMRLDPITVQRSVPVAELVEDFVYRHHFKSFPVVDGERLVGYVTLEDVRGQPRESWPNQTVGSIAHPCTEENTVGPEEDAMQALSKMSRSGQSRLLVVEEDRLVGILALRDLLEFFKLKIDLEKE